MKRKAQHTPSLGASANGSSTAALVKRRRGDQQELQAEGDVQPATPAVKKRARGRPPSEKTLRKRQMEAVKAEEAESAAQAAAQGSQVVSAEPSVDEKIKRLQEDEAKTGDGLGRRSSSMDRLYGMYEPKTPHSSRLRSSSTADPKDIQAAVEDHEASEAKEGALGKEGMEQAAEGDAQTSAGNHASPALHSSDREGAETIDEEEQPGLDSTAAAADKACADVEADASGSKAPCPGCLSYNDGIGAVEHALLGNSSVTATEKLKKEIAEPSPGKSASPLPASDCATAEDIPDEQPALADSMPTAPRVDMKAASAPVTPASPPAAKELEAPYAKAAFAAAGGPTVPCRPRSAPTQRAPPLKRAPLQSSPTSSPTEKASPAGSPVYIPLGKAAKLCEDSSPRASCARLHPTGSAEEPASAPAPAATGKGKAGKLSKRSGVPATLQLNNVRKRRPTRLKASAGAKHSSESPPQQPDLSQAPAELAETSLMQEALSSPIANGSPASQQIPGVTPVQAAEIKEEQSSEAVKEAQQPARMTASSAPAAPAVKAAGSGPKRPLILSVPAAASAEKRGGPMAFLLGRPKALLPKVTAITAPRPVAATNHRLSNVTDLNEESELTLDHMLPKAEDSIETAEEQRKAREQHRKAKEQQKMLKEIEMDLDRASIGVSYMKHITALVLNPSARGLEPRIVRGILERIEQATDTPHPAIVETNSKRKIAMLYVLDSMLQSGKAREKQTKEMDPDIIKSMQRFCNAVAVGLPTLVRSTQNDPGCYAKTLKTFKLWHKRDVLATKILEPHLENLQTNPVIKAPVVEAAQPLVYPAPQLPLFGAAKPIEPEQTEDFGLKLADDDDGSDEGGWDDDDAAPTLKELPKLPQMEEARKAPWQLSGGTDRAVGVAPDSPEGSPFHQGPSPTFSVPGEVYAGPPGLTPGDNTPPFEEKAARAPWHQPAPDADRPLQNVTQPPWQQPAVCEPLQNGHQAPWQPSVCASHAWPLFPHQMAAASYTVQQPQPQHALPLLPSQLHSSKKPAPWEPGVCFDSLNNGLPAFTVALTASPGSYTQAQRAASLPMPSSVPARVPITLSAPVQLPPPPSMASTQNLGLPRRQHAGMPLQPPFQGVSLQSSALAPLPSEEPGFMPPLPPDEPPPLPDEAPPPLPDEAPPPLPVGNFEEEMEVDDGAPPLVFPQEHVLYQQPVYSYEMGH